MRKQISQDSWARRKGKQTWIMRHEANSSNCMEIWNSKSGGNMSFDFEVKFGAFFEVYFRKAIYFFKTLEVKNLTLQTVCKSELK